MAVKYARFQIPAVAAGAKLGPTGVATFDDKVPRRLTGFRATNTTKLIHARIDVTGTVALDVDFGIFATFLDFVDCDVQYPTAVQISVDVWNDSAGALAVNTDAIVFRYEA